MIEEKTLIDIHDRIGRSRTPLTVIIEGVYKYKLRAYTATVFEKREEKEHIPECSIVGTYTEIGFDDFKDDVMEAVKQYEPEIRPNDLQAKKRTIINCILSRKDEFLCRDIIRITGGCRETVFRHIKDLIDGGQVKCIGTKPGTDGALAYALAGTEAANKHYPNNDALVMNYMQQKKEANISAIADAVNIPRSSVKSIVWKHLKTERLAKRKEGKNVIYSINMKQAA